jgi:hypothetical protein
MPKKDRWLLGHKQVKHLHKPGERSHMKTVPPSISPDFNTEQVGVPAAFLRWLGRHIAGFTRPSSKRW